MHPKYGTAHKPFHDPFVVSRVPGFRDAIRLSEMLAPLVPAVAVRAVLKDLKGERLHFGFREFLNVGLLSPQACPQVGYDAGLRCCHNEPEPCIAC